MAKGIETILDDFTFLVSETDERGIIKFANHDFCRIAEYELDELIGKPHNIIRHEDMPKAAFKDLWETIQKGNIWTGYVKNKTKSGGYYWVYAIVYPFESFDGKKGYMSCRRKPSKEEIEEAKEIYKNLK